MQYLLYAIAFYALLFGWRYVIVFLQLRKQEFRYSAYRLARLDGIPQYLIDFYAHAQRELVSLEFQYCAYLQVKGLVKSYPDVTWQLLLYHKEQKTYAIVGLRRPVEPPLPFDVEFFTFFRNKTLLVTMNGKAHGILGHTEPVVVCDPYAPQLAAQWQAHQAKLAEIAANNPPVALLPDDFAKALQVYLRQYLDRLANDGIVTPTPNEKIFRLTLKAALRFTPKVFRGAARLATMLRQRWQQLGTPPAIDIPVVLDVEAFRAQERLQEGLLGQRARMWMLLGSLLVFVVLYTGSMSPQSLVIVVGALLFHEGGHVLAMKLSGYRDASILFLPLLGAVATARKENATLAEKFWVAIAGPLSGLGLGIALAIAYRLLPGQSWLFEAALISIVLNLLNLIPVYPLDGGQIADLLLFSRFPWLGTAFKALGVLVLGWIGFGQPVMLMFAILIALSIPQSWQAARLSQHLRRKMQDALTLDRDAWLQAIFRQLRELGYGQKPFNVRYNLVKDLLHRQHEIQTQAKTRLWLTLVYVFCLVGGLLGSLTAIAPGWWQLAAIFLPGEQQVRLAQQRALDSATAAIQKNPKDVAAYIQRANVLRAQRKYAEALRDINAAIKIDPKSGFLYATRARLHELAQNFNAAIADYTTQIQLEPNAPSPYLQRAAVYRQLKHAKNAEADLSRAIALAPKSPETWRARSTFYAELKRYTQALNDANRAIALQPQNPQHYTWRGELHAKLGHTKQAQADRQKAAALTKQIQDFSAEEFP